MKMLIFFIDGYSLIEVVFSGVIMFCCGLLVFFVFGVVLFGLMNIS